MIFIASLMIPTRAMVPNKQIIKASQAIHAFTSQVELQSCEKCSVEPNQDASDFNRI
jgi:hypothetical protein